ncbi:TPA: hypothetical protein ACPZHP_000378 [Yersinia enterocolitica]|uniref:Uncharacterized protein n=1 Tax=Yersinia enterocolitica TaxID=630 RepID=A0A9P1PV50_YEREN|nr:hypothetical protein [Yersinia enterocolitica]EKN3444882.1 hypothetical protein [Yersinia enterocolitica]EKN3469293.1 hypothetical protein [Yersinia enterocolitica]EKN3599624.1 hypothetical protein [Yersinia enterocolitica]EKN3953697.1 hypothetical protein [Yersinia enterocolitica]EKN3996360.1 hypothetical protein [Yersinia enterocolitica]
MSNKIAVVYIGLKEKKRDTITGSRLVFPRHKPVEVESAIAHQLLDFPTVFIRHDELESTLNLQQASEQEHAELAAQLIEQAKLEAEKNSFVLKIGGDEVDIAKLTSVQLATLVESEDLDIKQGAQEKVDDFRVRVREAIQTKNAASTEAE